MLFVKTWVPGPSLSAGEKTLLASTLKLNCNLGQSSTAAFAVKLNQSFLPTVVITLCLIYYYFNSRKHCRRDVSLKRMHCGFVYILNIKLLTLMYIIYIFNAYAK